MLAQPHSVYFGLTIIIKSGASFHPSPASLDIVKVAVARYSETFVNVCLDIVPIPRNITFLILKIIVAVVVVDLSYSYVG